MLFLFFCFFLPFWTRDVLLHRIQHGQAISKSVFDSSLLDQVESDAKGKTEPQKQLKREENKKIHRHPPVFENRVTFEKVFLSESLFELAKLF